MEIDAGHIGLIFMLAGSVATNIVAVWMLRHNIPELHQWIKELREDFHKLDKEKQTRAMHYAKDETAVRLPGSHPIVKDAARPQ